MIIGDEKQSIYGFRKSDITVFDEVRQFLTGEAAGGAVYSLVSSRRSTRPIVEWCNAVFQEILPPADDREPFEAPFQALDWLADAPNGVWKIEAPAGESDEDEDAPRRREAKAVALFIKDVWDDAAASQNRRPDFANIARHIALGKGGSIAILCRTHAIKAIYENALQEVGVPYASVRGVGFWNSDGANWTLNLLRFFLHPNDNLALAAILRSPLVGLDDAALFEARLHATAAIWPDLATLQLSELHNQAALKIALPRVENWLEMAGVAPVSDVLEEILETSEIAFYEAPLPDAIQRGENWRKLLDIIRDRERRGQGSLRALVDFFAFQTAEGFDEADAAVPEGGAVQLMTVYAAKGLGFPLVVLGQMHDAPPAQFSGFLRADFPTRGQRQWAFRNSIENPLGDDQDSLLWTILRNEAQARANYEFRRLFYVACTRAAQHLVMVSPEKPRTGSWADLAGAHLTDLAAV